MSLKTQIQSDTNNALRAGDKLRVSTLRMLLAAIQQREVDGRETLGEDALLSIVEKQIKQRREAATQYESGARAELAEKELAEAEILQSYLPEPLSDSDLASLIDTAITSTSAASMKDMGKVMTAVREQAQGRADMGKVSQLVKDRLSN